MAKELSESIAEPHDFSDTSHQDPVDRRIIKVAIAFPHDRYKLVLGGYIDVDYQPARFFVFEDTSIGHPQPCTRWRKADYELAKTRFSNRWRISEVTEPYALHK